MTDRIRANPSARAIAGATAACGLLVLGLAAWMTPDQEGHGTHTQIGLPECGWAQRLDAPCMTCGMTTSFSHAADGALVESFLTQPFGMLLAVATSAVCWVGIYIALTGSMLGARLVTLVNPRTLIFAGVLAVAAWGYKLVTWQGAGG
ncbi:MAG: DUF2752 domain-containing protein [Planctomycetota bacterium]